MEKSKVYYTDFRTANGIGLPTKLKKLIKKAGMQTIDMDNKFVAIKIHFGELGNVAYLRPNYAKAVADLVKEIGGKPFLTDCNTLYPGSRKNALDHLSCAQENGFNELTTGCHVIIADGLRGTDDIIVPIEGGEYCQEAYIGRAVMDADVFISLSHFKGHENAGFGGCMKNIGMGCGSRAGKMEMHNEGKPVVNRDLCIGCHACEKICAHGAPKVDDTRKCAIDQNKCVGCGRCLAICPKDAITPLWDGSVESLNKKIAEYTKAVIDGRPNFHISIVIDVSPNCDCHGENDAAIVPNVGMFASYDPVALDMACADAVNAMPINANTMLSENHHEGEEYFHAVHSNTHWEYCIEHAEKIGLGTREYELIKI